MFERGDFIDTSEQVTPAQLGWEDPDRTRYEASGWFFLRRALRRRDVRPGEDVFVDFGSGKGRVVFQAAARYPFKRVIGVELAESLNVVARENLARNRHRLKCQDVEIVTSDAASYEIPPDMTIAYFYSPFTGELFQRVIDNIVASLERHPRRLRIVYGNPMLESYIEQTGRFELVRRSKGLRPRIRSRWISIWEARPKLSQASADRGAGVA